MWQNETFTFLAIGSLNTFCITSLPPFLFLFFSLLMNFFLVSISDQARKYAFLPYIYIYNFLYQYFSLLKGRLHW
ncbi:unnamed protein product [Phytomonas sp. EM1]|nr:unnamed protein product [Phytomonas sp. EM1]|eukprot:CCW64845.1 unnamed protein product [Phytomonas sp. isolate EM1]